MGRYYSGDIKGKFWFAIQSSRDASHFGVDGENGVCWRWVCCECQDPNGYEEEEDGTDEKPEDKCDCGGEYKLEPDDSNEITYDFDLDHVPEIQAVLDDIKSKLPDIPKPTIDDDDDYLYEIDMEWAENLDESKYELIPRWCLGHQILRCLEKQETCSFTCEC